MLLSSPALSSMVPDKETRPDTLPSCPADKFACMFNMQACNSLLNTAKMWSNYSGSVAAGTYAIAHSGSMAQHTLNDNDPVTRTSTSV